LIAQSRNQPIKQRRGVVAPDGRRNSLGPQVGTNIIDQAGRARQAAHTVHHANSVIDCRRVRTIRAARRAAQQGGPSLGEAALSHLIKAANAGWRLANGGQTACLRARLIRHRNSSPALLSTSCWSQPARNAATCTPSPANRPAAEKFHSCFRNFVTTSKQTARRIWNAEGSPTSANGMVRPCSCPVSDRSWQGAPKTRSTLCPTISTTQ
jgi:hypothetical protein